MTNLIYKIKKHIRLTRNFGEHRYPITNGYVFGYGRDQLDRNQSIIKPEVK